MNVYPTQMRRLLEILCNPTKRLPMETLKKCEAVLYRMQQDQHLGTTGGYRECRPIRPLDKHLSEMHSEV